MKKLLMNSVLCFSAAAVFATAQGLTEHQTNLEELARTSPLVSLIQMGTPFNPSPCQGFSISFARLSQTLSVSGCRGERHVQIEKQLSTGDISRLMKLFREWRVTPVPESAYQQPCPAFDGGGFRAQSLGRFGIEDYSMWACEGMIPNGVLEIPERNEALDELQGFVQELLQ